MLPSSCLCGSPPPPPGRLPAALLPAAAAAAQRRCRPATTCAADARHDYCGVAEDLELWWPKVKPGGIFAGHDYIDAAGVKAVHPQEDWGLCQNGTRHEGAVEGAVRDFAEQVGAQPAQQAAADAQLEALPHLPHPRASSSTPWPCCSTG